MNSVANQARSLLPIIAFLFSFPLHKRFLETALGLPWSLPVQKRKISRWKRERSPAFSSTECTFLEGWTKIPYLRVISLPLIPRQSHLTRWSLLLLPCLQHLGQHFTSPVIAAFWLRLGFVLPTGNRSGLRCGDRLSKTHLAQTEFVLYFMLIECANSTGKLYA